MRMLNRLGWAEGISFETYGLRLGVRVSEFGLVEQVRSALPHGAEVTRRCEVDHLFSILVGKRSEGITEEGPTCVVYSDAIPVARAQGVDNAIESLRSTMQLLIGEFARDRVFIHAGVVGVDGRAILLPGKSFVGKSRFVAALVRGGAQLYSDEYAVLSSDGLVHPFVQPISIRDEETHRGHPVTAEELGSAGVGEKPIPAGLVLLSRYREGAVWRPRRLTPGNAILEMLANTIPARRKPEAVIEALEALTRTAVAYKLTRGEAEDAAERTMKMVGRLNRSPKN